MRTTLSILSALAFVAAVNADEPKRLENIEAQNLMKRAQEAKAAGRYDEAHELAEKARQMAGPRLDGGPNANDRKEHSERIEKARHEIEELLRAGKHEEAGQLKRRLAGAMAEKHDGPSGRHDGPPGKLGEGPEKIRHLMEAIRHLREAGFNEPAENLEKMAHKMKEEFERRQKESAGHARGPEGEGRRKEGPPPSPEAGPRRGGPPPAPPADASPRRDGPSGPGPDAGPRRRMPPAAGPDGGPSPRGELQAIREQIEKLSRAVMEMRAQLNHRGEGGDRKDHEEVRRPRD